MKAKVAAQLLIQALKKLSTIDKPSDGNPKVRLQFTADRVVLTRADRDHLVEISFPGEADAELTLNVEWKKLGSVMNNGVVTDAPVIMSSDGVSLEVAQGKAIKIKLPGVTPEPALPHQVGETSQSIDGGLFFAHLKTVSILCVNRIVGRGKFSGVLIHPDRMASSSHDGAVETPVSCGVSAKFGLPYNVVWTVLNFAASKDVCLRLPDATTVQGAVRGVLLSGSFDGDVLWSIKFPFYSPAHSFSTYDLSKVLAEPEAYRFKVRAGADALQFAIQSTGSIQNKNEVWVSFSEISNQGIVMEATDIAKSSTARFTCKVLAFEGDFGRYPIQVKRTCLLDVLAAMGEGTEAVLGFDDKTGCMYVQGADVKCVLACTLKK